MIRYTVQVKTKYLYIDNEFKERPYYLYPGDRSLPNYYHARWLNAEQLKDFMEKQPIIDQNGNLIKYEIVELDIRFVKNDRRSKKNIPVWTSKIIGTW